MDATGKWLTATLQVRPGEGLMAAQVTGLMFFASAGGGIGSPGVEALFYARYGVQYLPYLYIVLGLLTLVTSLSMSGLLGRVSRSQLYGSLPLALALLLVVERLLLAFDLEWFYPLLWLGMNAFWVLQIQFSWGLAGMVCDTRQAKRLFPLFGAGGILGLAAGGLLTRPLVGWVGTENLLLGWAAGLGVAFALSQALIRRHRRRERRLLQRRSLLDDILQGYRFARRSALLRWMSLAAVFFAVLWFLLVFPFARAASAQFADESDLAGFLGVFQGLGTGSAILVSLLLANRLYARFGFMTSILVYPLIYLAGFSILVVRAAFPALVVFRFAQIVWSEGVAEGANQAMYNVAPPEQREQARAFVRGVANQLGVSLAGVILAAGEQVLQPVHLFWIGSAAAALTAYLVWQARRSYVIAVTDALRAGRPHLFFDEEQPFGGFKQDADAIAAVLAGIHSPEPAVRRVSAEILGQMPVPEAVQDLAGALQDPDAAVRAALVRAIARTGPAASGLDLSICLLDPEPEVRIEAVEAVRRQAHGTEALELALQPLLSDPEPAVRSRAAAALLKSGSHPLAEQVLRDLVSSDLESQVEGLKALAEWGSQEAYDLAARALSSPAAVVRRQAAEILARIDARQCIYPLIEVLRDDNLAVREAAARALGGVGLPALEPVMTALSEPDLEDGAILALEHLPVQRSAEKLRAYARSRAAQAQVYHRLWLEGRSFDDRDGPLCLVSDSLRDRSLLAAQRALRAVGLLGDRRSISLALENLQSWDPEQRANALEILEAWGEAELVRPLLRLWDLPGHVPIPRLTDWLERLLQDPDPWLQACAALAAREMKDPRLAGIVDRLLEPDPGEWEREKARTDLYGGSDMKTLPTLSLIERVLFLRRVPLFADLSPTDLKQIAIAAIEQFYSPGEVITAQGEMGYEMFIIVSGDVRVILDAGDGQEKVIARRKMGDVVGEMAMISQEPRMASLVADGEVRTLCIDQGQFEGIIHLRPETSLAVMRVLCQKLRECSEQQPDQRIPV